jgi:hypothetical protein
MTGPFSYLDPPSVQILNAPPAIPTFLDGDLVHQGDLNALAANVTYLLGGTGGSDATAKPLTVLRALTPNICTSGAAITCLWDTADSNNDGAWSPSDPTSVYVQTEGYYRINAQFGHSVASYSQCTLFVLVNGTDVVNNSIQTCSWHGNQGQVEVTVPLAKTASIQIAYEQTSGSSRNSSLTFGGCRLEVEWIAPTIPPQTQ